MLSSAQVLRQTPVQPGLEASLVPNYDHRSPLDWDDPVLIINLHPAKHYAILFDRYISRIRPWLPYSHSLGNRARVTNRKSRVRCLR